MAVACTQRPTHRDNSKNNTPDTGLSRANPPQIKSESAATQGLGVRFALPRTTRRLGQLEALRLAPTDSDLQERRAGGLGQSNASGEALTRPGSRRRRRVRVRVQVTLRRAREQRALAAEVASARAHAPARTGTGTGGPGRLLALRRRGVRSAGRRGERADIDDEVRGGRGGIVGRREQLEGRAGARAQAVVQVVRRERAVEGGGGLALVVEEA
eukprot:1729072-Rhodomonas_salina.1